MGEVEVGHPWRGRVLLAGLLHLGRELRPHVQLLLDRGDAGPELVVRRVARLHHPSRHPHLLVLSMCGHPRVALVLILLPPSEGKATPRRGARARPRPDERSRADRRARAGARRPRRRCARTTPTGPSTVLGLGPTQADDVRRNADLRTAPTARADAIYTGVLYESLDLATLDAAAKRRASRWLAVISSVFGLVRPGDRIPSYRLAGGVNLPGLGVVSAHWRTSLDPAVREAAGQRARGRPALQHLRRSSGDPTPTSRARWPPCACCTRSAAGAAWSATSTRPPRAGWSAPCSSSGASPDQPGPARRHDRRPGLEGGGRRARPARPAARRRRHRALRTPSYPKTSVGRALYSRRLAIGMSPSGPPLK